MVRYLATGAAVVLIVVAGLFLWKGRAEAEAGIPPTPVAAAAPADIDVADPPVASERTREERRFDRYDKDRDGRVTREEYLRSRRTAFAKLDVNGDGRLDFEEWAVRTTSKFATADADRSGAMDRAEFATTRPPRRAPVRTAQRCDCAREGDGD